MVRWLANHLIHVEMSYRIAAPLTSSQARKLGLPLEVGSNVSTRLEMVELTRHLLTVKMSHFYILKITINNLRTKGDKNIVSIFYQITSSKLE
jgi:hypothetical protein